MRLQVSLIRLGAVAIAIVPTVIVIAASRELAAAKLAVGAFLLAVLWYVAGWIWKETVRLRRASRSGR